jgi:hypothetical protein
LERDGKLFELFPMFSIRTLAVKTSYAGDKPGWSLDEFAAFLDSRPNAALIIENYNKTDFLSTILQYAFIDPKTGECNFNREDFEKILKIAERFPDKVTFNDADEYMTLLSGAADGDPLTLQVNISNFRSLKTSETIYFGEPVTAKGFPGENGASFQACARFAIAAGAKEPEGAWSFIKYMLEEYKDDVMLYLPLKLSLLDKMAQEAQEPMYYMQGGEKVEVEYEISYGAGGSVYTAVIDDNSPADSAKVLDVIKSTQTILRRDDIAADILYEEIEAYLSGQKPADAVADIIENRINLYISETDF